MDFTISEQMETILGMVNRFVDEELIPLEGAMLHGDTAAVDEAIVEKQNKVRQMGLWAANFPVEYGGLGLSLVDHGLLTEALGRSPFGTLRSAPRLPMPATSRSSTRTPTTNSVNDGFGRWLPVRSGVVSR